MLILKLKEKACILNLGIRESNTHMRAKGEVRGRQRRDAVLDALKRKCIRKHQKKGSIVHRTRRGRRGVCVAKEAITEITGC